MRPVPRPLAALSFILIVMLLALAGAPPLLSKTSFGVAYTLHGGGQFEIPGGILVPFYYNAVQYADGRAAGEFDLHRPDTGFSYQGVVTCLTVDPRNHRAWVGGRLTFSNDPSDITQPGDDVWFRVVDYGWSREKPDRTTVFGFKGAAGLDTSDQYCAAMPWPDADARTWPTVRGHIELEQSPWRYPR